jgi:hypothetical protein
MMKRGAVLAIFCGLLTTAVTPATAQMFRWIDEHGHVHYGTGLDGVPERYRSQATPVGSVNSAPAAEPAAMPRSSTTPETVIRFTPGKHIVVDVTINGSTNAKLYLDTGAGSTLISPRVLAAAGVSLSRGQRAVTRGVAAGTDVDVMVVPVESLEVGEAKVGRMLVTSYDMSIPDVDGLLGQDFLARFNVHIDPGNGVVKLTPK